MKKIISFVLVLGLCIASSFAVTDSAQINMSGDVPRGTGVVYPSGANLVGNLAISYDYNNSGMYSYISSADVQIADLGVVPGSISLKADYYGNEPSSYSCTVTFSSNGWQLQSQDASYTLPIAFSVPSVNEELRDVISVSSRDPGLFSLTVPISSPINGETVATVNATWPSDGALPSGDYTADIVIEVQGD